MFGLMSIEYYYPRGGLDDLMVAYSPEDRTTLKKALLEEAEVELEGMDIEEVWNSKEGVELEGMDVEEVWNSKEGREAYLDLSYIDLELADFVNFKRQVKVPTYNLQGISFSSDKFYIHDLYEKILETEKELNN